MMMIAGVGAAIGAILRYLFTSICKKWQKDFPWPTCVINLLGAFLLGWLFKLQLNQNLYTLLGTGILGGFTTFSTLNLELHSLEQNRKHLIFTLYLIISYLGGLGFVYLGYLL